MTIRVTPIGGEPVELPEETECIPDHLLHGRAPGPNATIAVMALDGARCVATVRINGRSPTQAASTTLAGAAQYPYPQVFVHIGDGWPLCTVETWRQRAERLERELDQLKTLRQLHRMAKEAAPGMPYMKDIGK